MFPSILSCDLNLETMKKLATIVFVLTLSVLPLRAQHHHHGAEGGDANGAIEKFGAVHMPISCAPTVQAPFERGIALMHSFWYEEAQKQFQAVAADDPTCAMAYWALAMTEWRPFWDGMPDDRRKAGIVEIDKATALNAKTGRERRYIAALSGYLHADPVQNQQALHTYDEAMSALHTADPDDVEATAFYGLALAASVGTEDPVGDARKALVVLEPAFKAHPDHPGFAHYIIHTCDTPQLAREALPAAEKYASIAPSSAHALHMPGHIFARLGMWQEDIDSNEASMRASELAEKNHQSGVTHEIHAAEFLLYAYLQEADDANAKRIVDNMEPMAVHLRSIPDVVSDGMAPFITYIEVEVPGIYDLETNDWRAALTIPEPQNSIVSTKYMRAWIQAIAAGHLRDAQAADQAFAVAQQFADATAKEGGPIGNEIAVTQGSIKAWQSFAHHEDAQALKEISAAADIQDRVGQAEVDIPAREMYADMLLADHRPVEALAQYKTALKLSPNRLNALYNAGGAAEQADLPREAIVYYQQLIKVANGGRQSQRFQVTYALNFLQKSQANALWVAPTPALVAREIDATQ